MVPVSVSPATTTSTRPGYVGRLVPRQRLGSFASIRGQAMGAAGRRWRRPGLIGAGGLEGVAAGGTGSGGGVAPSSRAARAGGSCFVAVCTFSSPSSVGLP